MGTTRTLGPKRAAFLPMAFIAVLVDQLGKYHTTTKIDVAAREPLAGDWISLTHMPSMSGAFGFTSTLKLKPSGIPSAVQVSPQKNPRLESTNI